jgi:hypothetical protein
LKEAFYLCISLLNNGISTNTSSDEVMDVGAEIVEGNRRPGGGELCKLAWFLHVRFFSGLFGADGASE